VWKTTNGIHEAAFEWPHGLRLGAPRVRGLGVDRLVDAESEVRRLHLGSGRIVASDIEAPNTLANLM
jgi:hypothetical protein